MAKKVTKKTTKRTPFPVGKVKGTPSGIITVYPQDWQFGGTWRWQLKSVNGRIIADSGEAYVQKAEAVKAAERVLAMDFSRVTLKVRLEPVSVEKPIAPVLSASVAGPAKVRLVWTDISPKGLVEMYHVERRRTLDQDYTEIAGHGQVLTDTQYTDESAVANTKYEYRVRSHTKGLLHSDYSNIVQVETPRG